MIDLFLNNLRSAAMTRQFALAIALACGTAVVATALPEPAHAQRREKKEEEAKAAPKPQYSKEFVAAYQPLEAALKAEGADIAALRGQLDALAAATVSPDEKAATGGVLLNAGIKGKDYPLQLRGVEMMLTSGKLAGEEIGRFNFVAYQISINLNDYAKAESYLQQAIAANFTTPQITAADLQLNLAELYFAQEQNKRGLQYLGEAIAARRAAGQPVDQRWYRRGVTVAYNNQIVPDIYDFVNGWVTDFPSQENWRDAINLTRNLNDFEYPSMLDLMRLARRVGTLTDKNDYLIYIEAADARRLPKEVKDVIEDGYAKGKVGRDDPFFAETLGVANGRIATDRADLPALERDAGAAAAQLRTVVAAGSAFLSYDQFDKAVRFFEKAAAMPGADQGEVLTRLGIAQVGLGDYAAAQATFAKVDGPRAPIARLWSAYAAQQAKGTVAPVAPASGV